VEEATAALNSGAALRKLEALIEYSQRVGPRVE
jgi:anthranilate phosphoribosyltransferase